MLQRVFEMRLVRDDLDGIPALRSRRGRKDDV